ncbi:selection and upkeep of intraepithelial T-cells protein 8-like [Marmota marmota marmota]|uniref:selection and upkeep of intraepithelial T-cells protein 8-like n=1 Tax=Marmota marmota marmota TaxID=9994 RepID=UPI002092FA9F|nr:selection and upkeep of intraepithelial T-cells protein 8-like [Marmota marmota marmota]
MMEPASSYFSGYCMCFLLLQVMTSTSEKLMVTVPKGHLVARVGGQAALSCQLSPPQSAEHMEVHWFRGDNSQLVYLYRGGHEVNGEAAPEYVNRTEFVKEAMGEGKVTLKIHNVSISDDGPYRCLFKDTDFSDMASMNLIVAALGLETQIHVQVPTSDGLVVECNSGGWFPQPQMEWRDSRGEVVPHSSKSYSQDGARLFHMKMTLLLRNFSDCNITCCVHNPVIGEEKQTSIILANDLFDKEHLTKKFLILFSCLTIALVLTYICLWYFIRKDHIPECLLTGLIPCCYMLNSIPAQFLFCFICSVTLLFVYLPFRTRVSISDPLFSLYNSQIKTISIMICVVMLYSTLLITGVIKYLEAAANAAAAAAEEDAAAADSIAAEAFVAEDAAAEDAATEDTATGSPEISSLSTASFTSDANSNTTAVVAAPELEVSCQSTTA